MTGGVVLQTSVLNAEDALGERSAASDQLRLAQAAESIIDETASRQQRPAFEDLDTAASGLNDALDGARAKLDQLREATEIAAIAAQLREELEASAEENNRLSTALTEAEVVQRSLKTSQEAATGQIAALTRGLEEAKSEATNLDQQLRESRERTASTESARIAVEKRAGRAEQQLNDSQGQNEALSQEIKILKHKLATARKERDDARFEINVTRQERDVAHTELDKIRLRIAGLLRSVLHADDQVIDQKIQGSVPAANEAAAAKDVDVQDTYKIVQPSNIRAEPRPDAKRVDFAVTGETVSVLRKVQTDENDWFEVRTKRGVIGFIFGELIQPSS
ncbi:MAG: SH3 domain-containing protein [Geminicoccaceae bacterium]